MLSWFWSLVLSSAIASGVVGVVLFLFKSSIAAAITKRIEATQQMRVAAYKAQLDSIAARQKNLEDAQSRDQDFVRRNLETFRNRHAEAFNKLQIAGVEAVWDSVVASYKIRLHTKMLRAVKIEEFLKRSKDKKIQQYISIIAPPKQIDQYIEEVNKINAQKYRPFVSEEIWKYYSAYNSIMSAAIAIIKAIEHGVGDEDFFEPQKTSDEILKTLPSAREGVEKYGWEFIFYTDETLEELIILEIQKFIDGDEANMRQIDIAKSLAEATSQQPSNTSGLPEELLKPEVRGERDN